MKKILLSFLAVVTLVLSSCGGYDSKRADALAYKYSATGQLDYDEILEAIDIYEAAGRELVSEVSGFVDKAISENDPEIAREALTSLETKYESVNKLYKAIRRSRSNLPEAEQTRFAEIREKLNSEMDALDARMEEIFDSGL